MENRNNLIWCVERFGLPKIFPNTAHSIMVKMISSRSSAPGIKEENLKVGNISS